MFFVVPEYSFTVFQILNRLNSPTFSSELMFVVQIHSIFCIKQIMYLFLFSSYFSILFLLYSKQITVQQFDYEEKSKKFL